MPASLVTYYIVDDRLRRPLDRSVQAQRSRARRATALPQPFVVRSGSRTAPYLRFAEQETMQSALQMALRDITTLPKSRSGGEESDGSEVCLALLIVSSPPFLLYSALDLLGKRSLCREQEQ